MVKHEQKKYYIFGAHPRGQTLGVYLKKLYPEYTILGYLYDNGEDNPESINGVPVKHIDEGGSYDIDLSAIFFIATRGVYHEHIESVLRHLGATDIIRVDAELDRRLRGEFVPRYFSEHGWEFNRIDIKGGTLKQGSVGGDMEAEIYVVRSHVDSPLTTEIPLNKNELYIQAGTSLTDYRVPGCSIWDNIGDNISEKNRQFCELTALYWAWKNSGAEIIGIEHYRRRFLFPENCESLLDAGELDVILPVPLFVNPNIMENYTGRHDRRPWEAMMKVLADYDADCAKEAKNFFETTGCYSPCNMLIVRKGVLNGLCSWLFPILFKVNDECGILEPAYQNRYPGFLSERLITYFFYWKRDVYRVGYCDKSFLE